MFPLASSLEYNLHYKKNNFVEKYYHTLYRIIYDAYGSESPQLGEVYENLGYHYILISDYNKGKEYYNKSINIYKKNYGKNYFRLGKFVKSVHLPQTQSISRDMFGLQLLLPYLYIGATRLM